MNNIIIIIIDVLLCHDDELEGRRIAFIFYLVPEWTKEDGGQYDYRIAGNFRWIQFSQMVDLDYFTGLIFTDVSINSYPLCTVQSSFFVDLIFVVRGSSVKTAKNGPLENFPLLIWCI